MSVSSIDLPADWQAEYLFATSWAELERARTRAQWPRVARLPEMRAEPGVNAALYRQKITAPALVAGQRWEIAIGAAMLATQIWINGKLAGQHWGGYTPFAFDVSTLLIAGENEIVIGVRGEDATFFNDGKAARCAVGVSALMLDAVGRERWTRQFGLATPCPRFGVTQAVTLVSRPIQDIDEVFVYADAGLTLLTVELAHSLPAESGWEITISDTTGRRVATQQFSGNSPLFWKGPDLRPWSPESPTLYYLDIKSVSTPDVSRRVRFGWRSFTISGAYFYLNGRKTILRGESDLFQNQGYQFHDPHGLDIPALQRPDEIKAYLAGMKRDLGVNAFRQHAAIGAPAVFAAADEVGLLVLNQSSVWSRGFPFYLAGGETFLHQTEKEFGAWIRRDRNHPSVVIWGVENEMLRIGSAQPEACAFFRRLEDSIAKLDPTRPRTFDGGAAVLSDVQVHHVHHEENYDVLLREWQRTRPLLFGEFWVGGRNAERRLTNAAEFANAAQFYAEMNRLWAGKIIGLRLGGASGVMPYNFVAQILQSGQRKRRSSERAWSESWLNAAGAASGFEIEPAARKIFRHALGPCLVEFSTRSQAFYVSADGHVDLPVVVRNDSEAEQAFTLRWAVEGRIAGERFFAVPPGEAWNGTVVIAPGGSASGAVKLTLATSAQGEVDATERIFYFQGKSSAPPALRRPVFYVSDPAVDPYVAELRSRGVSVKEWRPGNPVATLDGALLIVPPGVVPAVVAECARLDVRGFVVEGVGTFPGWLGTGGIFDLKQPYLHSNHFDAILGRAVQLDDLYHPNECLVEDCDHPALARWPAQHFTGFDDAESDVLTRGLIVHPTLTLLNIMGDMRNVGAGMNLGEGEAEVAMMKQTVSFRPLLSSSRREYASLAEIVAGDSRWMVNRLRLGEALGGHPWADALWQDALAWLDSAPVIAADQGTSEIGFVDAGSETISDSVWKTASTLVIHNLERASAVMFDELSTKIGAVRRVAFAGANYVAVEHGGFFAASKSASILQAPIPFKSALEWNDASAVVGAWRLLQCDESFEVKGHAFPWAWRSDYPKLIGYAALHLHRHGRDFLMLLDDLNSTDPSVSDRYRIVLATVRRAAGSGH